MDSKDKNKIFRREEYSKMDNELSKNNNNRNFVFIIFVYLVAVYSIYFYLDTETITKVGREDGPIEYLTFFFFLGASFLFLKSYILRKNLFYLLFSFIFFLGAGEEISWGQRIFNFSTPESLNEINVQHEFNLHNIEVFNGHDFEHNRKSGLSLLLSINFLYKIFWLSFGVVLPVIVMYNKKLLLLTKRVQIPVPPFSIGVFFLINWALFRIMRSYILQPNAPFGYYFTINETMESGSAFIFLVLSYYFYKKEI